MSLSSKPYKRADETQLEALKATAPTDPHVLNRDIRLLLAGAGGACVGSCSLFASASHAHLFTPTVHSHSPLRAAAPCSLLPATEAKRALLPQFHPLIAHPSMAHRSPRSLHCTYEVSSNYPLYTSGDHRSLSSNHPPHTNTLSRPTTQLPTPIFLQRAAPPKRRRPRWSASRSSCSSKR
jgi:hypothetical protein